SGNGFSAVGVADSDSLDYIWMGINSAGFAIENSHSPDLEGDVGGENGILMKWALLNCATVAEFEQHLIQTNISGRGTQANFGVIDATGEACIFETGNHSFTKFDANDPQAAPQGFIVRTNFGLTGDGTGGGLFRYNRANELLAQGGGQGGLTVNYILKTLARDLKNDGVDPYPLPYEHSQEGHPPGYIRTDNSINRYTTCSAAVFQGVRPGEDPRLSTMWCILGEPVCGIAVPVWSYSVASMPELDGLQSALLCDACLDKEALCYTDPSDSKYINTFSLQRGDGQGVLDLSLAIEDWIMAIAESFLQDWRQVFPSASEVEQFQREIISQGYALFLSSSKPSDIHPPKEFYGSRVHIRSLSQREYINVLSWQPHPDNGIVDKYRLFRIQSGGEKHFIADIDPNDFFYWHRQTVPSDSFFYILVAVDLEGNEGIPAYTIIPAESSRIGESYQVLGISSVIR
ncbi:hypothetical protein ACFLT9_13905, partial [Acidobacteriota bacterium]